MLTRTGLPSLSSHPLLSVLRSLVICLPAGMQRLGFSALFLTHTHTHTHTHTLSHTHMLSWDILNLQQEHFTWRCMAGHRRELEECSSDGGGCVWWCGC